jgi:hypothetical protein
MFRLSPIFRIGLVRKNEQRHRTKTLVTSRKVQVSFQDGVLFVDAHAPVEEGITRLGVVPHGTRFFPFRFPGTGVPRFLIPPLRGWSMDCCAGFGQRRVSS